METIRYYERIGMLSSPPRSAAGYRAYQQADVERLRFIVRSRTLGFGLDDIRGLLTLASDTGLSCVDVDALARKHLQQIEAKQQELAVMSDELRSMIQACHCDTRATCSILRTLAESSAL